MVRSSLFPYGIGLQGSFLTPARWAPNSPQRFGPKPAVARPRTATAAAERMRCTLPPLKILIPARISLPDIFESLGQGIVDHLPLRMASTPGIDELIMIALILENLRQPGVRSNPISPV